MYAPVNPWSVVSKITPLLLILPLLGACAHRTAQSEEEKVIPIDKDTAVTVSSRNGRIRVVAGAEGAVRLTSVKRVRAASDPRALLDQVKVRWEKQAGHLRIWAEHPDGSLTRQFEVRFRLEVPPATRLVAHTRNGQVETARLVGDLKLETRNGAVEATGVQGRVHATTRNGAVRLAGAPTGFVAQTHNGKVSIDLGAGTRLVADSSAETRNGAIHLVAPGALNAVLSAKTRNGAVQSELPLGKPLAAGAVHGVRMETRNGAIRVSRR